MSIEKESILTKNEALAPSEIQYAEFPINRHDLSVMTAEGLTEFIFQTLLIVENERYSRGNTAEHKLLFLIGGPDKDVATATTSKGEAVYSVLPGHPKAPEFDEATTAISNYFEHHQDPTRVVSEVTDIFYNLLLLTQLDTGYAEYLHCIDEIANALGFSFYDVVLLSASKFEHRLIDPGIKDPDAEEEIIRNLLDDKAGKIKKPTDTQIASAYRILNRINTDILQTRLRQIQHWTNGNGKMKLNV